MATFADNLKRLRAEAQITQVELAKRAELTQSAISRYETGEDVPEVSSLLKLATGLRVPLEPLVEGLDVKFDAVYRDLRVSITTDNPLTEDDGTETAELPADVLPGAPEPMGAIAHEPEDLAATREELHRTLSHLVSVVARLPHGPTTVARHLGSELRPRAAQTRARTRRRAAPKTTQKRR